VNCGKYRCGGPAGCLTSCSDGGDCTGSSVCDTRACGGLKGDYFEGRAFNTLKLTRTDGVIDFTWSGAPASGLPTDSFSVRWTGKITPRFSEAYTFFARVNDGVRLWVGNLGTPIIDSWKDQSVTEYSGMSNLTAGQAVDIKVEYYEGAGGAEIELLWQSPSQARETVPAGALTPP